MSDSFWRRVDREPDGCWQWTGYRRRTGYGEWHPERHVRRLAHRHAYELLVGAIPDGKVLDHLCRNRGCVNPAHLEPVTIGENVLRGDTIPARWAQRTHCQQGHALTPDNLKKDRGRGRECRTCDLENKRRSYALRKVG